MPIERLLPFNIFDLFAYLANGFIVVVGIRALLSAHGDTSTSFSPAMASDTLKTTAISIALAIVVSYVVGHLVAHLAYPLYDRLLVQKFFGDPGAQALAGLTQEPVGAKGRMFALYVLGVPEYARRFSPSALASLRSAVQTQFGHDVDSGHYSIRSCFSVVNENAPRAGLRIEVFLGLYSFCRNNSAALLSLGVASVLIGGAEERLLSAGLLIGAVFMFGRYLRFLKFYTDEILLTFTAYVLSREDESNDRSDEKRGGERPARLRKSTKR